MGMLSLHRLMLKQERKRRRRIQFRNKKDSLCKQDEHSEESESSTYPGPNLPEDIWCLIHSLMPLRDSARSACVSHTFLRSWRCHPKLILTEETLGLHQKDGQKIDLARGFTSRVNHILNNHSGAGVKILKFVTPGYNNFNTWRLNSWLKKAITPGIEEVTLLLSKIDKNKTDYNFPYSILLDGRGNSIRYLHLTCCAFRPMVGFDCLRSLTKLHLYKVCITGDELGYLLSSSLALEDLKLRCCREIVCLKIPFLLKRLSYLRVSECDMLQVIESSAPNLSTVDLYGEPVQLIFGESSQVKNLNGVSI